MVDAAWAIEVEANDTIARYLAICDALMDSKRPFAVDHVRAVLFLKGISLGLQTSGGRVKAPLLSDMVIEQCGRQWLALVLPALAEKADKVALSKVDGVFYMTTSASTVFAYILACAVLFDSAEGALNALAGPLPPKVNTRARKRIDIDLDALSSEYVGQGGNYAKVAKRLGIAFTSVANRLSGMGLPNMIETEFKSTQKALSAYLDEGCTLQQSVERGGISQTELLDALRVMAAKQMKALPNFGIGRPKGSPRSYPLMPAEAKCVWVASDFPMELMDELH